MMPSAPRASSCGTYSPPLPTRMLIYRRVTPSQALRICVSFFKPGESAAQEMAPELSRLLIAEFLRFAHHAQNSQPLHATLQIEFDQAVDTRPINVADIGERRCRDRVHALRGRIEQLAHGPDFLRIDDFFTLPRMPSQQIYTLHVPQGN